MTLTELRDALAKATGPDMALDESLYVWLQPRQAAVSPAGWPDYTASIDAAVTLVPEGWSWEVRRSGFGDPSQAAFWNPKRAPSDGRDIRVNVKSTPALALCLARVEYELAKAAEGPEPTEEQGRSEAEHAPKPQPRRKG